MDKYPREMSGGMQQRVGIARAIALKPKVLLLDEPFGRLDSLTRMELQDVILDILDREKITTVLVSHDVDEVVFLCDRVVMMTNGPAATIGEVLSIDFPKPRDRASMMEDPLYFKCLDHLVSFLTSAPTSAPSRVSTIKTPFSASREKKWRLQVTRITQSRRLRILP